jgi:hypothetical protein
MRPLGLSVAVALTALLAIGAAAGAILIVTVAIGLQSLGGPVTYQPILFAVVAALVGLAAGDALAAIDLWHGRARGWPLAVALHGLVVVGVAVAGATGGFQAPLVAGGALAVAAIGALMLPSTREALAA